MPYLKMLWQQGTPPTPTPTIQSWDFWTSKATRTLVMECGSKKMYTVTSKIVYYAIYESVLPDYSGYSDRGWFTFLFMSPDLDAVSAEDNYHNYYSGNANQYITDNNGIKWYYQASSRYLNYESYNPDYRMEVDCDIVGQVTEAHAAQTLLDKIYAVPFHEDYQSDYYLLNKTDVRKTIRKGLGLSLAFNISNSASPNYQYISNNADVIISDVLAKVGNNTDISLWIAWGNFETSSLYFYYGTVIDTTVHVTGTTRKSYNFERHDIGLLTLPYLYRIDLRYGTPTIVESEGEYSHGNFIGIGAFESYPDYISVEMNNLGIDL